MTRLLNSLAIAFCIVGILVCLGMMVACDLEQPNQPWTKEEQCQFYNKWAEGNERGGC